jgi:hypothetical protein
MYLLEDMLKEATRNIEDRYFHLKIFGGNQIFRERVYCYELYHQMRIIWPKDSEYTINGELDKSGNKVMESLGVRLSKPDFLIHKPGTSTNYAVIEVKNSNGISNASIKKDLCTLCKFKKAGYSRSIYLLYGDDLDDATESIKRSYQLITKETNRCHRSDAAEIELWYHSEATAPATLKTVLTND